MDPEFAIQNTFAAVTLGLLAWWYVAPWMRQRPLAAALIPLLALHVGRYIGLTILQPGITSPELPDSFARGVAWGDLAAAVLAFLAIALFRSGHSLAVPAAWGFTVVGVGDFALAYVEGVRLDVVEQLGSWAFVTVVVVPVLLVSHALIVWRLVVEQQVVAPHAEAEVPGRPA